MKINLLFFLMSALLTLQSCQTDSQQKQEDTSRVNTEKETPAKMIDILVGEWQMDTGAATPQGNAQREQDERIVFTQEARYIQYSGGQKVDSGAYRMNEQLRNLYFESEANGQPREFEIELQQNMMTLKPKAENQSGNQSAAQGGQQPRTYRKVSSNTSPSR